MPCALWHGGLTVVLPSSNAVSPHPFIERVAVDQNTSKTCRNNTYCRFETMLLPHGVWGVGGTNTHCGALRGPMALATWAQEPLPGSLWVPVHLYCHQMMTQTHPKAVRGPWENIKYLNFSQCHLSPYEQQFGSFWVPMALGGVGFEC